MTTVATIAAVTMTFGLKMQLLCVHVQTQFLMKVASSAADKPSSQLFPLSRFGFAA